MSFYKKYINLVTKSLGSEKKDGRTGIVQVMRNRTSNVIWGVLFIVAGIGFAGNSFGLWHFHLFFKGWWTFFIILPCLVSIIQKGADTGNVLGLCLGIALFLGSRGFLDFSIVRRLIVPVIFVAIGASLLLGGSRRRIREKEGESGYDGVPEETSGVFGQERASFDNQVFSGAPVRALFGNACLDLRRAVINQDVQVDATAIFGSVEILAPDNVTVKVLTTPVFGSVANRAGAPVRTPAHTLYINATCVFGGITIQ